MDNDVATGILIIQIFVLVIEIWALVKCLSRPTWAFHAAGKSKTFWLIVLIIGFFLPVIGLFVALGYLFSTDRKVRNQAQLGPGIGFPGGPPQY
jgi:hypothetical protein